VTGETAISRPSRHASSEWLGHRPRHFWPALSSDGRLLVYVSNAGQDDGMASQIWRQQIGGRPCRVPGVRVMRPIFIGCLSDGTSRKLGDDCRGRPLH